MNTVVISTAPVNNFGASTAHLRYLAALVAHGVEAVFISTHSPPDYRALECQGVWWVRTDPIVSDAYPNSLFNDSLAVTEAIVSCAQTWRARNYRVILAGSYLYPFVLTALHAASILRMRAASVPLVVVPAGSDIWQIGRQVPAVSRHLLNNPSVSGILTYSLAFATEIMELGGMSITPAVVPPPIDTQTFAPCGAEERIAWREALNLAPTDFVIVNSSNMRPVKEVGLTIRMSLQIASRTNRRVVLLLVGPVTDHLRQRLAELDLAYVTAAPSTVRLGNAEIRTVGLQPDTRPYLWAADVAVNTSVHDSFNISVSEALGCGLPVISTDFVGIREVIGDSPAAYYIKAAVYGNYGNSYVNLVERLDSQMDAVFAWVEPLMRDASVRASRAACGRAIAESLSVARIGPTLVKYFDEVASSHERERGSDISSG